MAKKLNDQEVRDLKYVFQLFDSSGGDGLLDLEDLRRALSLLGFKLEFKQLRQIALDLEHSRLKSASHSARGGVAIGSGNKGERSSGQPQTDLEGFLHIVASLQDTSYDIYEEIKQGFAFLDEDGDGYITKSDLQRYGRSLGLRKEDLQGMIDEADKDGDGKVNFEEFVSTMKQTNLFKHSC